MGKRYDTLSLTLQDFIKDQALFFVGTAAPDGRVNISPKGMDSLRVLSPTRVLWLSVTGSGNETAAHLLETPRMTLMWCAFEGRPLILRAYGEARVFHPRDEGWAERAELLPSLPGARNIFELNIDLVQTSCGMAVPYFDYAGDRDNLKTWAEAKGPGELEAYWAQKNQRTIDDKPTGIFAAEQTVVAD